MIACTFFNQEKKSFLPARKRGAAALLQFLKKGFEPKSQLFLC